MHRMHGGKPHSLKYPRVSAKPLCKESPIVRLSYRLSAKVEAIKDTCRGKPQCKEPHKEEKKSYHSPKNQEDKV